MKEPKMIRYYVSRFILLWISISFFLFCNQVFGAIPSSERAALIALYNSTDGDNWDRNNGWKTPPLAADGFAMPGTENSWLGITCDTANSTVREISMVWNNLQGNLPPELGSLTNLISLKFHSPFITGSIPPELGSLTNLQSLMIKETPFTGSIPSELGNLTNLQSLELSCSSLTGGIPPELGSLTNLQTFDISCRSLTGRIPPELGNLQNLKYLRIIGNNLTGSIPPELGNLDALQTFELFGNNLTGSIPPELGNLINLLRLYIEAGSLTGSIPPELGNLNNLRYFNLKTPIISGSIPRKLGNLTDLTYLVLSGNSHSGKIPPELGNLSHLENLDLSLNNLTGSIPQELGNLSNLRGLYLYDNNLTGSIPPELANLNYLENLSLPSNNLTGSIPPELGNLSNLEELYLFDNKLTGSIPSALGNLTKLIALFLQSNRLSGPIPDSLQNLVNLGSYGTLYYYGLILCWNALYTDNDALRDFLDEHHDDGCSWENTQTVPPEGLTASPAGPKSIKLKWTPISYKNNQGSYLVFYSTAAGGPFELAGKTADKYASSLKVTGLNPSSRYYFKIKTRTESHAANRNTLDSEFSQVVSASIQSDLISISGTITYRDSGLPGVTLSLSNYGGTVFTGAKGYYYVQVESGWSGTITPSRGYYRFAPAQRTYTEVSSEQTDQDFEAFIPVTLHIGAERKTERAFIISRDYGMVTLSLENKSNIPGIRCVLEKKIKGGTFQPIKEFAAAELSGGPYVYTDKFLDRDKSYTYRLVAYDSEGNHLISSPETTI